jgi:hypothetical protein
MGKNLASKRSSQNVVAMEKLAGGSVAVELSLRMILLALSVPLRTVTSNIYVVASDR